MDYHSRYSKLHSEKLDLFDMETFSRLILTYVPALSVCKYKI